MRTTPASVIIAGLFVAAAFAAVAADNAPPALAEVVQQTAAELPAGGAGQRLSRRQWPPAIFSQCTEFEWAGAVQRVLVR